MSAARAMPLAERPGRKTRSWPRCAAWAPERSRLQHDSTPHRPQRRPAQPHQKRQAMEGNKEAQKEARINTGLRNYWYPVAASWNVKNAPVGITRLSQNIVLWRD